MAKLPKLLSTDPAWSALSERRTIRRFEKTPVPKEDVEHLVQLAQRAPTACSFQTYSFIAITLPDRQQALKDLLQDVGSASLPEAPVWLIGCVDLDRYFRLLEAAGVSAGDARHPSPTRVLFGVHDLGLAVSNLVTAAEAMGYATMLHGCVMYRPQEVAEFLNLPRGVLALEAIALGVPDESPPLRPRWSTEAVLFWNEYMPTTPAQAEAYLAHSSAVLDDEGYYTRYTRDHNHLEHILNKTRRGEPADIRDGRVNSYLQENYFSLIP